MAFWAAVLICLVYSFISKEILTIREAVWLTDNTYKYEDLVRMMGEIISALEGKIRVSFLKLMGASVWLPVESGHHEPWADLTSQF